MEKQLIPEIRSQIRKYERLLELYIAQGYKTYDENLSVERMHSVGKELRRSIQELNTYFKSNKK